MANNENVNILAGNITPAEKAILKVIYKLCLEDPRGATPKEIADEFEKSSSLLTTTNQYSYDAVKQNLGRITKNSYLKDVISKNEKYRSRYLYNFENDKLEIGYELMLEEILEGMNKSSNVKTNYKKIYDSAKSSCPLLIKYHKERIQEYNYALVKDVFFDDEKGVPMLHALCVTRYGFVKEVNIPITKIKEVTELNLDLEMNEENGRELRKIKKNISEEFEMLDKNIDYTVEPALITFTFDLSRYNENLYSEWLSGIKEFFSENEPKIQTKIEGKKKTMKASFLTYVDKINEYLETNSKDLHIKISFLKVLSVSFGSIKKDEEDRKRTKKIEKKIQSGMQTPILYYAETVSNSENLRTILTLNNELAEINKKYFDKKIVGNGDLPEFEEETIVDDKFLDSLKAKK